MNKQVRILILEDTPADVDLLIRHLKKGGMDPLWENAVSETEFRKAVQSQAWDLILSDYNIPGFGALKALEILKEVRSEIPFLVISGAIGEETAVGLMKAGAQDYVMKSNLAKLIPTLERTLREAEARRREEEARRSEERALRDREHMLAIVSHDLKNPLVALKLNHQLMERILKNIGDSKVEQQLTGQLGRAQRAVVRMETLIRDVLDMAKIDSGTLVIEKRETRVDILIAELMELFEPLFIQKSILMEVSVPEDDHCTAYFDEHKIHQVLSNLIGNAIKYTPEKGTVTLKVKRTAEEFIFSVTDTGPGIPAEVLPRIFDRYYTVETRTDEGTGLGLAIAHGIVMSHQGRLWVESTVGSGSTFFFSLPRVLT